MESTWTTQTWQSIRGADHSQVITETNSNIGGGSMLLIHSASLLPIQTAANGYGSKFETHENYSRDWVMFSNKELHPTSILLRPPSLLRLIFIQFFVGWNTSKTSWSNIFPWNLPAFWMEIINKIPCFMAESNHFGLVCWTSGDLRSLACIDVGVQLPGKNGRNTTDGTWMGGSNPTQLGFHQRNVGG